MSDAVKSKEIESLLRKLDKNHDNKVSFAEFDGFFTSMMADLDAGAERVKKHEEMEMERSAAKIQAAQRGKIARRAPSGAASPTAAPAAPEAAAEAAGTRVGGGVAAVDGISQPAVGHAAAAGLRPRPGGGRWPACRAAG